VIQPVVSYGRVSTIGDLVVDLNLGLAENALNLATNFQMRAEEACIADGHG